MTLQNSIRRRPMKSMFIAALTIGSLLLGPVAEKASAQAPSDPQIAGIVQTANQIDIDQAKLALKRSTNSQVKEFANQMITDHQSLMKSVADLAKKLKVTPQASDTSKQLKQQADDEAKKVKTLRGA